MNTTRKIMYGAMPLQLRLMLVLLALLVISEFFRALTLSMLASHHGPAAPVPMLLATAIFFGVLWELKSKSVKSPIRAAAVLVLGLFNNAYSLVVLRDQFHAYPWVSTWWPVLQLTGYALFICVLLLPATRHFYRPEGQDRDHP